MTRSSTLHGIAPGRRHRSDTARAPRRRNFDRIIIHSAQFLCGCASLALAALLATPVSGQELAADYPSRPIRIVVGFAPGGPTDLVAREIAAGLQESWGQPVIVDNKPGASSRIAFEHVARAAPDGYTLLIAALQTATNMAVYRKLDYDTLRDFAPVTQLTSTVLVLAMATSTKAQTVADLVELARAHPGELTYASFGVASSAHLAGTLLEQEASIRMTHVPFNGAAPAEAAIVGGQVDLGFMSALSAMPLLQSGKLRPLAVTSKRRLPQLPDVPTMSEAGLAGVEVNSWQGLLAPARTPPEIVNKLHREIARVLAKPRVRERFASVAAEPVASSPAAFRAYIQSEIARWTAVARQAKIALD